MIDTQRLVESGAIVIKTPLRDVKGKWDLIVSIVKNDDVAGLKDVIDNSNKFNPFAIHPDTKFDVIQYMITYDSFRVYNYIYNGLVNADKERLLKDNKYILLAIKYGSIDFVKLLLKDNPFVKDIKYNFIDSQKTILSEAIQWYDPGTMSSEFYSKCRKIIFTLINAGLIKDNIIYYSEKIDGYNVEFEMTMQAFARYYNHDDRIINALVCKEVKK